ncbi:MAG: protease complex subunit PrcB family protein [Candidatus Thorarchaeota archaeon]
MKASTKALAGIVVCIVLATSFLLFSEYSLGFLPSTEVFFEVIDPGGGYDYEARDNFAIRDAETWESLWLDLYSGHSPIPEVPVVDFTSEMLIAVFQGERSSGGYSTNITQINMTIAYYIVYVDEIHPGENCVTISVMTYPYCIVKISDLPLNLLIRFVYNITIYDCD